MTSSGRRAWTSAAATARGWPSWHRPPPVLTLADRLLATTLHQRLALPQVAIAVLFSVAARDRSNKRIRDIRQLLKNQAWYTIRPGPQRLTSLDDLYGSRYRSGNHHASRDQDSVLIICKL